METACLSDLCQLNMGQSPPSDHYNTHREGLPFYQGNADFGKLNPHARVWCNVPKKTAKAGDILLSVRAPIGALNIATETCCIGRGLAALTAIPGNCVPMYLYYALKSKVHVLEQQGNGSIFKAIGKEALSELKLPVYPLEKQEHIAHLFRHMDRMEDTLEDSCSVHDELVKSRFVEMFGDININDKNWPVKPLGELCSIYRGGSPRPINAFLGGDVPWIKIGDATKGDEIYLHETKEHIIQEGVKKSRMVKKGSLIFANCGVSLGFARIITFDGCIHDGWLSFEDIDESLDKVFLLLSLNQMTEHFREIAPEGTQPNLNVAIMKGHQQIIPPINLQRQFVEFIKLTDKSKFAVPQSIETLRTLKAKLMQEYFG